MNLIQGRFFPSSNENFACMHKEINVEDIKPSETSVFMTQEETEGLFKSNGPAINLKTPETPITPYEE